MPTGQLPRMSRCPHAMRAAALFVDGFSSCQFSVSGNVGKK
jgi:hypothetical protein